jgi:hypothetical protein
LTQWAAIVACVMLVALAFFQAGLASGAPWGHLAWGGKNKVLPPFFRAGSFIAIVHYGIFGAIIVQRAGLATVLPQQMVDVGIWVIAGYLALGVPMNAISRSMPEKLVMTPVAAVLLVLVLIVAFGV